MGLLIYITICGKHTKMHQQNMCINKSKKKKKPKLKRNAEKQYIIQKVKTQQKTCVQTKKERRRSIYLLQ